MKVLIFVLCFFMISCCEAQHYDHQENYSGHQENSFKSERISQSATILLRGEIQEVFPLFNPVEEQKWAPSFRPVFIYPTDGRVEPGMSFKTPGHLAEGEWLWILTRYDVQNYALEYLITAPHRYWTISIKCGTIGPESKKTTADITYTYTALNSKGMLLNRKALDKMFADNLLHWQKAINAIL